MWAINPRNMMIQPTNVGTEATNIGIFELHFYIVGQSVIRVAFVRERLAAHYRGLILMIDIASEANRMGSETNEQRTVARPLFG